METDLIAERFDLPKRDYSQYSPLTLAYIGDAVFDLVVRSVLVSRHNMQPTRLHRAAASVVKAPTQARMAEYLQEMFDDEEKGVYRRGKNASPNHQAKNASREDYMKATGFEAVIGYLYLTGRQERILELVSAAFDRLDIKL